RLPGLTKDLPLPVDLRTNILRTSSHSRCPGSLFSQEAIWRRLHFTNNDLAVRASSDVSEVCVFGPLGGQTTDRFVDTPILTVINSKFEGGDRFRRGYSESTDAYRGPSAALKSLENTIANSELALAA